MLFGARDVVRTKKVSEYFVFRKRYYVASFTLVSMVLITVALYANARYNKSGKFVYNDAQSENGVHVVQKNIPSCKFSVQLSENLLDKMMEHVCKAYKDIDCSMVPGMSMLPVIDEFIGQVSHVFKHVQHLFMYDTKCAQFYDNVDMIGGIFVSFYNHFVPCHTDYRYLKGYTHTVDKHHNEISIYIIKQYMFTYLSYQDKVSSFSNRFVQTSHDDVMYTVLCNMNINISEFMQTTQRNIFKLARGVFAERQILLLADKLLPLYAHNISCEAFKTIMTEYGYCDCLCLFVPKFGEYAFDTIVCLYNFIQRKPHVSMNDLLSIVNKFDDAEPAMQEGDVLDKLLNSKGLKYKMKYYNEFKLLVGKLLALRDCAFLGCGLTASFIYSQNSAIALHVNDVYVSQLKTSVPPVSEWGKESKASTTGYLRDFDLTHTCAVLMTGVFNMMLTYILTR